MENVSLICAEEVMASQSSQSSQEDPTTEDELWHPPAKESHSNPQKGKRKRNKPERTETEPVQEKRSRNLARSQNGEIPFFETNLAASTEISPTWKVKDVSCPDSCSLFNTVNLSCSLVSSYKFCDYGKMTLSHVGDGRSSKPQNGLWMKLSLSAEDEAALNLNSPAPEEYFMLIELYQKQLNSSDSADQLVSFCSGKCGKKRKEVIEMQEQKIEIDSHGFLTLPISINEQCAHKSDNEYGSPNTRFYFKITLCSRTVGSTAAKRISGTTSGLIKVVAPGKNKLASVKVQKKSATATPSATTVISSSSSAKAGKQSMRALMENFVQVVTKLNENMTSLDSRMQNIDMRVSHLETAYVALSSYLHTPLSASSPSPSMSPSHTQTTSSQPTPMAEDEDIKEEPFIDANPFSSPRSQETEHCYSTRHFSSPSKFLTCSQDEEFISLSQELANNVLPPSALYESTSAFPKN